jgi:phosphatidylinositol alpha 1,6-mannosyltransferase
MYDIPVVANFQTDVSGFINFYRLTTAKNLVERRLKKIHTGSTITLAPSTDSENYLKGLGIENIHRWGRGVDLKQFHPKWRSKTLRKSWGADSQTCVIGFVGRLAPEKQVHKLANLSDIGELTGKKVVQVIVGDGPSRAMLEKALPSAIFLGHQSGESLSKAMASMDLLVTTGENETFCQVIQEAMAAGLFYTPGDDFHIRKRVLTLVNFEDMRLEMGRNAFATVQTRTWSAVCSELFALYTEVLAARKDKQQGHAS